MPCAWHDDLGQDPHGPVVERCPGIHSTDLDSGSTFYSLPQLRSSVCTDDTWTATPAPPAGLREHLSYSYSFPITSTLLSDGFESGLTAGPWRTSRHHGGLERRLLRHLSVRLPARRLRHGGFQFPHRHLRHQTRLYRTTGFAVTSAASSASLTFWMYHDTGYGSANDTIQPQVSTDGSTWVNAGSAIPRYSLTEGWSQATVSLTAYIGQASLRIAFLGTGAAGNDMYIDDISVTVTVPNSTCSSGAATTARPG